MDAQPPVSQPTPSPVSPTPIAPISSHSLRWGIIAGATLIALAGAGFTAYRYFSHPARQNAEGVFNKNNPAGAVTQLDTILGQDPKEVTALVQKSLALAQQGSLEFKEVEYGTQAVAVANQAIALDATSSEAYRALGYAYEIQQKYPEAHAAYEKAISLNPNNGAALFGEAHSYDLEGNLAKAETGYTAALVADPNLYGADLGLGRVNSANGKTDAAITYFKKVYTYAPSDHDKAQAAYSIGMLLITQKNYDLARGYLQKATTYDATYPSGWFGLGVVEYTQATASSTLSTALRADTLIASVNNLNTAIKLNPNQSAAHLQLAKDLFVLGQKPLALSAATKAEAVVPNDITLSATEKTEILKQIADFKVFLAKNK